MHVGQSGSSLSPTRPVYVGQLKVLKGWHSSSSYINDIYL